MNVGKTEEPTVPFAQSGNLALAGIEDAFPVEGGIVEEPERLRQLLQHEMVQLPTLQAVGGDQDKGPGSPKAGATAARGS